MSTRPPDANGLAADVESRTGMLAREVATRRARAALVTRPEHIYALTGFEPNPDEPAIVLAGADRVSLVWPGEPPAGLPSWIEASSYDPFAAAREDATATLDAIAQAALDAFTPRGGAVLVAAPALAGWFPAGAEPARRVLESVMRAKTPREAAIVERNLADNDAAFSAVSARLAAGASDFDVYDWCASSLTRGAGEPVAWAGNVGLGAAGGSRMRSPRASARPTARRCSSTSTRGDATMRATRLARSRWVPRPRGPRPGTPCSSARSGRSAR